MKKTSAVKSCTRNEDEEDILKVYRALPRRAKHEFMAMVYDFGDRKEYEGDKANAIG